MAEFQATKIVKKTRKTHQCCICNRTIPIQLLNKLNEGEKVLDIAI